MSKHYEARIEYTITDTEGVIEWTQESTAYFHNRQRPPDDRDIRRVIAQQEPDGIEGHFAYVTTEVRKPWWRR